MSGTPPQREIFPLSVSPRVTNLSRKATTSDTNHKHYVKIFQNLTPAGNSYSQKYFAVGTST